MVLIHNLLDTLKVSTLCSTRLCVYLMLIYNASIIVAFVAVAVAVVVDVAVTVAVAVAAAVPYLTFCQYLHTQM